MFEELLARYHSLVGRVRRVERRELREFRRWLEHTSNMLHLSVLVFVPLLIGVVTWLSNASPLVSFLIFPPLAAGTYTLFADPEGPYSSPTKFVGGMSAGALSGWIAVEVVTVWGNGPAPGAFQVHVGGAVLGVFLTGVLTWGLDLEAPTAYSTALLVLLLGERKFEFVVGVAITSGLVAIVFYVWREQFYEERARFLYRTTSGDDHVLVPMRQGAPHLPATAAFAATVAGDHETGKVVLMDVVDDADTARAERDLIETEGQEGELVATDGAPDLEPTRRDHGRDPGGTGSQRRDPEAVHEEARRRAVAGRALELEQLADELERAHGVPCEVVVAVADGWSAGVVEATLAETGCDLVVASHEGEKRDLSSFVAGLFELETDVITFRSSREVRTWERAMVAVRSPSANAHAMVDFARRVTGASFSDGRVSVCHCIDHESQRRRAETMLANLVDAFSGSFETRVARSPIERFLSTNAAGYDLVVVGASTDRTAASRFMAPPTFTRIVDVDADVAVVHRGR